MATPIQRAEHENCLIAIIGSGSTANVWLSVPKDVANRILAVPASLTTDEGKRQACEELSGALQATKVAIPFASDQMHDLSDEIAVMKDLAGRKLDNMAKMLQHDNNPIDKVWFSAELLRGRTLEQVPAKLDFTENFAWHCVLQLTETILEVFFGMPQFYQGDVRAANIMFLGRGQEVFPDVVLIDFGQARKIAGDDDAAFFDRQREDVRDCFKILAIRMGNIIKEMSDFAADAEQLFKSEKGKKGNARLYKTVRDLRDLADERIGEYNLSPGLIEYFCAGIKTEEGRLITMDDLLHCQASKDELDGFGLY